MKDSIPNLFKLLFKAAWNLWAKKDYDKASSYAKECQDMACRIKNR